MPTHDDGKVDILSRREVYRGFARIESLRLRHQLHAGGWSGTIERELYDRGHVAAVLPYDPATDMIVLLEQFRIGAHAAGFPAWQLEAVAGMIDAGESAEQVVRREAREEADIEIGALEPIAHYLSSPGASSETVALFCGKVDARTANGVHGRTDENEDIAVRVVPAGRIPDLLVNRAASNGLTVIALQWLWMNRIRLQQSWCGSERK